MAGMTSALVFCSLILATAEVIYSVPYGRVPEGLEALESLVRGDEDQVLGHEKASEFTKLLFMKKPYQSSQVRFMAEGLNNIFELDFEEQPICIPTVKSLIINNLSRTSSLNILGAVILDSTHFHLFPITKDPVSPEDSRTLHLAYIPRDYGEHQTLLYIKTSEETFSLPLKGKAVPNPYGLEPVSDTSELYQQYFRKVSIYNPYDEDMQIDQVFTTDNSLHIKVPGSVDSDTWRIPPKESREVLSLYYEPKVIGNHNSTIHLKTSKDSFMIPVNLAIASDSLLLDIYKVWFGIMTNDEIYYKVSLTGHNRLKRDLKILDVSSSLDHLEISIPHRVLPVGFSGEILSLVYRPAHEGLFTGNLNIKIDSPDGDFVVPLTGLVLYGMIYHYPNPIVFTPTQETTKNVTLIHKLNTEFYLNAINTDQSDFYIHKLNETTLSSNENAITFPVTILSNDFTSRNAYFTLDTGFSSLPIPVIIHDEKLECYEIRDIKPSPCVPTIEFGNVGENITKYRRLGFMNISPVKISIDRIDMSDNVKIKEVEKVGAKKTTKKGHISKFSVNAGETIYIDIILQSDLNIAPSNIVFYSSIHAYNFTLSYTPVKGSFELEPLSVTLQYHTSREIVHLYVQNNYPVPIHINTFRLLTEFLSVNSFVSNIPAMKRVSIAEVMLNPKFNLQTPPDFSKSLTYHEIESWKERSKSMYEGNSRHMVQLYTDVLGEITGNIQINLRKARILAEPGTKDLGKSPVNTYKKFNIKVENPSDAPMTVQLFLSSDPMLNFHISSTCSNQKIESIIDEEEFEFVDARVGTYQKAFECSKGPPEEIRSVKELNSRPIPSLTRVPSDIDLMWKIKNLLGFRNTVIEDGMAYTEKLTFKDISIAPKTNKRNANDFYLLSNEPVVIKPGGSAYLGPVLYQTDTPGRSQATIILRNSLTGIEKLEVVAEASAPKLSFVKKYILFPDSDGNFITSYSSYYKELQVLDFQITIDEIMKYLIEQSDHKYIIPDGIYFVRKYELKNTGDIPVSVNGMYIEGQECYSSSFSVMRCDEPFKILPNDSVEILVKFYPNFMKPKVRKQLWIVTEQDIITIPIEATLPVQDLSSLVDLIALEKDSQELMVKEVGLILAVSMSIGTMIYMVKLFQMHMKWYEWKKQRKWMMKSSKDSTKKLCQPHLNRKYEKPILESKQVLEQKQILESKSHSITKSKEEMPPAPPPVCPTITLPEPVTKPKKIRPRREKMDNTIIQNISDLQEVHPVHKQKKPETSSLIFANNKLILKAKKNKTQSISNESEALSNKPASDTYSNISSGRTSEVFEKQLPDFENRSSSEFTKQFSSESDTSSNMKRSSSESEVSSNPAQELQCVGSLTITEDESTIERMEEDFFIDNYKLTNCLFGSIEIHSPSPLEELLRDSDPKVDEDNSD
jgi:hypothetical protein